MAGIYRLCYIFITILSYISTESHSLRTFSNDDIKTYREKVKQMFSHAYDNYVRKAFPYDELQPISCRGMDTWGSFSLTLIDALDTLAVMKNYTEFKRVVNTLLSTADFNVNINVSVFETNIRVVGGLLSAHLLSRKAGLNVDPGWPCSGPLLTLAEKVARRLLPAFNTSTGMPYGTVNLKYGVPKGETPITCTAGVSTFIIEFGTLSHLTGDPVFENVAVNALDALWKHRSSLGLVGNHINVQDGKWTALDAGIGGGVDSYFEYLVKGSILFQEPKYLKMFKEYERLISKYMKKDDWYFWVSMSSGQVTMPIFQSLEAFWPGLLTLIGDIEQAVKTLYNYHQVWKQYGFTPEIFDVAHNHAKRENYPLRPAFLMFDIVKDAVQYIQHLQADELIESIMYLYYATKDQHLLEIGVDILESIEHSAKTDCGYATIKNVVDHKIEDRMESFFLAETTKYLYLLFDPENFIHNNGSCGEVIQMSAGNCVIGSGGYVFNTEAHPIDVAAVYCCSAKHFEHQMLLQDFQKSMDLHSILEITDSNDFLKIFRNKKKTAHHKHNIRRIDLNNKPQMSKESSEPNVDSTSDVLNPVNSSEYELSNINGPNNIDVNESDFQSDNVYDENNNSVIETETNILQNKSEIIDLDSYSADETINISTEEMTESTQPQFNSSVTKNKPAVTSEENSTTNSSKNNKVYVNSSDKYGIEFHNFELLACPAQPYSARLNLMGQMFNT